jgi:hypothetical protein
MTKRGCQTKHLLKTFFFYYFFQDDVHSKSVSTSGFFATSDSTEGSRMSR